MSSFAEIIASSDIATRHTDYLARMAYVNKVSRALAQRLYSRVFDTIKTAFDSTKAKGLPSPPSTILSFSDACLFVGLPVKSSGPFDPSIPVFADANGDVFPQEISPDGGFPVLAGDLHRIPISQCIFGFTSGPSLTERGISPLLDLLHSLLNSESYTALYLVSSGHAKLCIHIVWDVDRFVYNQTARSSKYGKDFKPTIVIPIPKS